MELQQAGPHDARTAGVCLDLDGGPGCIAVARDVLAAFLRERASHAHHPFHADVVLVASELATNAVRHAGGPFSLELGLLPDGIGIAVRDSSPALPRSRPADGTGGRGWPIVESLARQVSVFSDDDGKTVYVELAW
ncbi:ATP-binding protein [Streptomyces sp. NPDC048507]|uniref:ATP-binding protein n=1 Tax=Streptomyces sp. NPDC048507 TaxID=3365560 RepID=UPI003710D522